MSGPVPLGAVRGAVDLYFTAAALPKFALVQGSLRPSTETAGLIFLLRQSGPVVAVRPLQQEEGPRVRDLCRRGVFLDG